MSLDFAAAALSILPAAALWLGYPRRPWMSWIAASLGLLGAAWFLRQNQHPQAWVLSVWALAGALYSGVVLSRHKRRHNERQSIFSNLRAQFQKLGVDLEAAKGRGILAGLEQKQALALYGLVKGLTEALSWEEVRPRLESAAEDYLGTSDFAFYLVDPSAGFRPLLVRGLSMSPGSSWITLERCLQERGLSAAQAHALESPEKSILAPISDGEVLGFLYARCPPKMTPAELLGRALFFVQDIAFAFRRIRLFQEMENLSRIDGLTGVHRRGSFDERLKEELVRAQTFKTPLVLLFLDIDHFKELNDRYGHPFGDQVLKRLGEILNASVYETDFVARYGGEEFAVILPRALPEGAARKAEAIRKRVEEERFSIGFSQARISVSIGMAQFPRDAARAEELVAQADAALYRAKSMGRNQVVDRASLRG
ncbi:MAG: GGDEF domain-containing protein [Elusimicrobiota bacterium]